MSTFKIYGRGVRFLVVIWVTLFIFHSKLNAQKPLLLESTHQHFDSLTQTWSDDLKYIYSYDQNGNLIQQTRKNLNICLENCPYYSTWEFAQVNEYWKYNDKNQEEWNYNESLTYHRQDGQHQWELDINSKSSRITRYNEDSLILFHERKDEYPAIEEWQVGYTSTNTQQFEYNNYRKPVLAVEAYEYIGDQNHSGQITKTKYDYNGELKVLQKLTQRDYSDGDTTFYRNETIQYFYLSNGQIDYSLSETMWTNYQDIPSYSNSKQTHTYNSQGNLEREDNYNWNFNTLAWELITYTSYTYNPGGTIKESEQRSWKDDNTHIQINRYTYNDVGKIVLVVNELYDQNEIFIKELFRSYTTWYNDISHKSITSSESGIYSYLFFREYNSNNKLLNQEFEFVNYGTDSMFLESSLIKSVYTYDQSGYLLKINETRVSYDQDSLIAVGCCGFLYESEEIYENRCDGAPLIVSKEQWNYIPGTNGAFNTEPILTRQINTFNRSLCNDDEIEYSPMVLYPNPTTGPIRIKSDLLNEKNTKITLTSMDGNMVKSTIAPITRELNMDLIGLAPGIYVIRLINDTGHSEGRIFLAK